MTILKYFQKEAKGILIFTESIYSCGVVHGWRSQDIIQESFFLPPTLWGLNLGRQAWQQTLLPHEPSYQPTPFSLPHAVALSLAKLRLRGSLKGS